MIMRNKSNRKDADVNAHKNYKMFSKIIFTTISIFLITIVSLSAAFYYLSVKAIKENVRDDLSSAAHILKEMDIVKETLERRRENPELDRILDDIIAQYPYIDLITVADMEGIRVYHVEREKIYKKFAGGDEERALQGESYFSTATGTQGPQYRYLTPVYSDKKQVGFIMVSTLKNNFYNIKTEAVRKVLLISSIALVATILLSFLVYRSIKRSLLGYEPEQIVSNLLIREEVMNNMEEGIIYVNTDNEILFINNTAKFMMNLSEEEISSKEVFGSAYHMRNDCVEKQDEEGNIILRCRLNDIIYKQIPIYENAGLLGTVYILTDKKLAIKLAEELTGVNYLVASLRANNHEFLNKLHVISGLIQSGNDGEALEYISEVSSVQQDVLSKIFSSVKNRNIAALLLGKVSYCRENEIKLHIHQRSYLPKHSAFLSTYSITTILGNLINNAVESIARKQNTIKGENIISVYIRETDSELTIMIEDTGTGMDETTVEKLLDGTYISARTHHGIGFKLIRNIVQNAGGVIDIESEENNGTNVAIFVNRKRKWFDAEGTDSGRRSDGSQTE